MSRAGPGRSRTVGRGWTRPSTARSCSSCRWRSPRSPRGRWWAGSNPGSPWAEADWEGDPGWTFTTAADDSPEELYRLHDEEVARARERFRTAVAHGGLDRAVAFGGDDFTVSLRRLLFDLLEEYGRHTGHADLIREALDGRVGEDPPPDWSPPSSWLT